jgi:hypothetical protein
MRSFRVRVFLSESNFSDTIINADNWFVAQMIGMSQSPIRKAINLGDA